MRIRAAVALMVLACGVPAARAQITTSFVPGNFTYQFADPTTGQPISALTFANVGDTKKVALYLAQTGGTPPDVFQQLGAEALGVRLIYSVSAGNTQVVRVPGGTQATVNANITPNSNFDFNQRDGSTATPPSGNTANHTADTSVSAQLSEGLLSNPVVFPGPEDPLAISTRMLIGTFTLQAIAAGTQTLIAADPFDLGNQNLTGPNPPTAPPDGFHGEIKLDQFLSQNVGGQNQGTFPTLAVTVPEPGTLALGSLAVAGLAAWRGRRTAPAAAI